MRKIIILTILGVLIISCGKSNKKNNKLITQKDSLTRIIANSKIKVGVSLEKDYQIGKIYNDVDFQSESNKSLMTYGININYNVGKFTPYENENLLVDSTLSTSKREERVLNFIGPNKEFDEEALLNIDEFSVALAKYKNIIHFLLLKKVSENSIKILDKKVLGAHRDNEEHLSFLSENRFFSHICHSSEKREYFGIVIDKLDKNRKYEKVIKVWKLDLINEKFEEIDLKKEKIECLPED